MLITYRKVVLQHLEFEDSSVISGENIRAHLLFCNECPQVYDQVNKRIWWMPRQLEAMKDVEVCDKLGRAD